MTVVLTSIGALVMLVGYFWGLGAFALPLGCLLVVTGLLVRAHHSATLA